MIENTMRIHTCANNNNNNDFFIYLFIFLHICKYAYPEREQMNPKDDINNKWTHPPSDKVTNKLSLTR